MLERATQGVIRSAVCALGWACRYLSRLLLARAIIAVAVIAASLTIAVYALWIGAILWMVTGRFGILRRERWRLQVEVAVSTAVIAGLIAMCAHEGRPPANLAVIGSCALGGAIVWFHRDLTLRSLRAELSASLNRKPSRIENATTGGHRSERA